MVFLEYRLLTPVWVMCVSLGMPVHYLITRWRIPDTHVHVYYGLCFFACGAMFFHTLFCCGIRMLNWLKIFYLSKYQICDISNKFVSIIQATMSTFVGLILLQSRCVNSEPVISQTGTHFISVVYAWFGAPYFLYDIWSMFIVYRLGPKGRLFKKKDRLLKIISRFVAKEFLILTHHILAATIGFLMVLTYNKLGNCFYGYIYMMELSTPFVSLRHVLTHLRMKSSRVYVINGLMMIATFFWSRIRPLPYMLYTHALSTNQSIAEVFYGMPVKCKVGILLLFLPQCYWFALMVRGAVKLFWDSPKCRR